MKVKEFKLPEGLNDGEQKLMASLTGWITENLNSIAEGQKSVDELTKEISEKLEDSGFKGDTIKNLQESIKKQGEAITALKENPYKKIEDSFEVEIKSVFEQMKSNKGKGFEVAIKAAAPVMTPNVPAFGLRFEVEPGINRLDPKDPTIYNSFIKGQTDSRVIHWINYKAKEGGSAFIGEGVLKPLKDWQYEEENSTAKKIAVRSKHSEEIFDDFDDFMSEVRLILSDDLRDERDTQLLLGDGVGTNPTGVTENASAYIATGGINDKIIMPNLADVIVACALQVRVVGRSRANLVVLNAYDKALLDLTKTEQGNYLTPELKTLLSSLTIVESEDMPVGKLLVCDSRRHKVKNKKGILMKTVYENDDMTKNMVGFVVEQFLFSYRSSIYDAAFVYDDIATVQAALAAPVTP